MKWPDEAYKHNGFDEVCTIGSDWRVEGHHSLSTETAAPQRLGYLPDSDSATVI